MAEATGVYKGVTEKPTAKGTVWEVDLDGLKLSTFEKAKVPGFDTLEVGCTYKVEYNEIQKGQYTNRYLNKVEKCDHPKVETVTDGKPSNERAAAIAVNTSDDRQRMIVRQNALTNANTLLKTAIDLGVITIASLEEKSETDPQGKKKSGALLVEMLKSTAESLEAWVLR